MLGQCFELLVCLGKSPRLFARACGYLHRWLNSEALEQSCKLVVRHERVLVRLRDLQQLGLLGFDRLKVSLQQWQVQLQLGLDEHAQRAVNDLQLLYRKAFTHAGQHEPMKQCACQLDIVDAVATVPCKLFW